MKQQLLRDATIEPTSEVIAKGLEKANSSYINFIEELKKISILLMDWRYYNDGKAWLSKGEYKWITTRGTNKVKPIFWLSIWEGFFKVSFLFSSDRREELMSLPISEEAKKIIEQAEIKGNKMKSLPIIFDITNERQIKDVIVLAEFRKEKI